jgi:hypothetical protein
MAVCKKQKAKKRCLSPHFMMDIKEGGLLNPLLERVKKDPTLCLEIRQDYINIYYRGGNIIKIEKKKNYVPWFDTNYCICGEAKLFKALPNKLCIQDDVSAWIASIPILKQAMDYWFGAHPKEEREFQQLILRENNGLGIGNSTDYFIIDIEYDNRCGARFDLVAIEWESDSSVRKLQKQYAPKLTFIELKYGDGALSGQSGILKHIRDFKEYLNKYGLKSVRDEMVALFKQKRELGLIPALVNNKNVIEEFSCETDFIFLFANHDPATSNLRSVLDVLTKKYPAYDLGVNLKFCTSNFMGYGLYKQSIYSLTEFVNKFCKQI